MIPYQTFEGQVLAILDELHAYDENHQNDHRRRALKLSVALGRMAQKELDETLTNLPETF